MVVEDGYVHVIRVLIRGPKLTTGALKGRYTESLIRKFSYLI